MRKVTLNLAALVVTLALQGCIIFPGPGHRTDAGVAPREVHPNITTRAKLLEKGPPDLRTPDERFFLYQNSGSREWLLCVIAKHSSCNRVGTDYWARWVVIEFDERGVAKNKMVKDCEKETVCDCPQTVLLAVLEGYYSSALAAEYGPALEREDPLYGLHQAVAHGDVQQVKSLLEQGADPSVRACGRRPLYSAITQGNGTVTTLLLEAGADPNVWDGEDHIALHLAVSQGNTVLVDQLLAHGANLNATDRKGRTALHLAVSEGNAAVVERLIAAGANVNAKDYKGDTALQLAISKRDVAVVERLIGQPPGALHGSGEKLEYKDAEGLLWTFTFDKDKKGRTILHVQSKEGTWTLKQTR